MLGIKNEKGLNIAQISKVICKLLYQQIFPTYYSLPCCLQNTQKKFSYQNLLSWHEFSVPPSGWTGGISCNTVEYSVSILI